MENNVIDMSKYKATRLTDDGEQLAIQAATLQAARERISRRRLNGEISIQDADNQLIKVANDLGGVTKSQRDEAVKHAMNEKDISFISFVLALVLTLMFLHMIWGPS